MSRTLNWRKDPLKKMKEKAGCKLKDDLNVISVQQITEKYDQLKKEMLYNYH